MREAHLNYPKREALPRATTLQRGTAIKFCFVLQVKHVSLLRSRSCFLRSTRSRNRNTLYVLEDVSSCKGFLSSLSITGGKIPKITGKTNAITIKIK